VNLYLHLKLLSPFIKIELNFFSYFHNVNTQYSDLKILSFYGWWEMSTCLFAFLALIAIWYHVGKKKNDFGQVWLALSILCWSFSGLADLLYANNELIPLEDSKNNFYFCDFNRINIDGFRSVFSLLNSLFILLALPYFKYIPKPLSPVIKSKFWAWIIGLPFIFSLLPTLNSIYQLHPPRLVSELDAYYGVLTLGFLGYVLWESFSERRLKLLAYLSMICIAITFASQILKLGNFDINTLLLSAIFKTSLIMIFFALALSWIKDLTETLQLNTRDLSFDFALADNKENRHMVGVSGINNLNNGKLKLTRGQYNLFKTFAEKRHANTKNGWLEIKPKSETRSSKVYDINDHNEVKRLLHGLLDEIYGKGLWSKIQHEEPLKESLFEQSDTEDRKIRLKITPENLSL